MTKSTMIKLICLCLALVTVLACFAACGEPQTGTPTDTGSGDPSATGDPSNTGNPSVSDDPSASDGQTTSVEEGLYLPAQKNYNNYEFKMYAASQNTQSMGHYCHAEGAEDVINNALYERELLLQDMYGIILKLETADGIVSKINEHHTAQKAFTDLTFIEASNSMKLAMQGKFWNLNLLEELNLEASYYDQRIQQNFRIGDMLFQLTGDYAVLDELVTFGILYNEAIYKEKKYDISEGSPYKMVTDYKWTYSKMMTLAAPVVSKVDANIPQNNTWGVVGECQAVYYFYLGSGMSPISSNNGVLKVNLSDKTTYDLTISALTELLTFSTDECVVLADVDLSSSGDKNNWDIASDIFEENRALFRTTALTDSLYCVEMKSDFGILPVPMLKETQRAYYSLVNANSAWPLCIPLYVEDIHRTAEITEIMSYYSRYGGDESLYEAFFERLQIAKLCRKPEDRQMLQLIFANKVYCLDWAMEKNIGMRDLLISMTRARKGADGLSSSLETKVDAAGKTIPLLLPVFENKCKNQASRYDKVA